MIVFLILFKGVWTVVLTIVFSFLFKGASSLTDDDIKLSERLYIPGRKLRGFESGKIGPKDGSDYIGGNYISVLNATTTVPKILENVQSVDIVMFADAPSSKVPIFPAAVVQVVHPRFDAPATNHPSISANFFSFVNSSTARIH